MDRKVYDFNQTIDRKGSNSVKWDENTLGELFTREDALPLWIADMDFKVADPILESMEEVLEHGIFGYSTRPDSYYQSIIDWMDRRFDWKIEKDWIVYTPGVIPAINYILQEFTEEGDKVLVQDPVYNPFKEVSKKNSCEIVNNRLIEKDGEYFLDLDLFRQQAKDEKLKVFIFCSPHNPIGKLWSEEEIMEMMEICWQEDILVISDEVHNDLIYKNRHHHVTAKLAEKYRDNIITCTAPSKTFNLAGLQSSNIIISNKEIRERFLKRLDLNSIGSQNPLSIVAVEAAYNHGENWLNQLMEYLEGNIEFIEDYLEENLPRARFRRPDGGYLAWVDLRDYEDEDSDIYEKIGQAAVAFNPGKWFGQGGQGFVRINMATSRENIKKALDRLKTALE